MVAAAPHGNQRGNTELCSLVAVRVQGNSMGLCEEDQEGARERFFTKGWSCSGTGSPGQCHGPSLPEFQVFGQHSQKYALNFGWYCVNPEVGHNDFYGFLTALDVL